MLDVGLPWALALVFKTWSVPAPGAIAPVKAAAEAYQGSRFIVVRSAMVISSLSSLQCWQLRSASIAWIVSLFLARIACVGELAEAGCRSEQGFLVTPLNRSRAFSRQLQLVATSGFKTAECISPGGPLDGADSATVSLCKLGGLEDMQDDDDDESDVAVVHDEDEEDDDEDEEEEAHGLVSVENVVTDGANGSSGSSRLVGDWASLLVSNMSSVKPAESKGIMALAAAPQSMR